MLSAHSTVKMITKQRNDLLTIRCSSVESRGDFESDRKRKMLSDDPSLNYITSMLERKYGKPFKDGFLKLYTLQKERACAILINSITEDWSKEHFLSVILDATHPRANKCSDSSPSQISKISEVRLPMFADPAIEHLVPSFLKKFPRRFLTRIQRLHTMNRREAIAIIQYGLHEKLTTLHFEKVLRDKLNQVHKERLLPETLEHEQRQAMRKRREIAKKKNRFVKQIANYDSSHDLCKQFSQMEIEKLPMQTDHLLEGSLPSLEKMFGKRSLQRFQRLYMMNREKALAVAERALTEKLKKFQFARVVHVTLGQLNTKGPYFEHPRNETMLASGQHKSENALSPPEEDEKNRFHDLYDEFSQLKMSSE